MSSKKELKELHRQREKADGKGDFAEAARICNVIGELLFENGEYLAAAASHKEEVKYSEVINDKIGVAIAHRKVGEAYCEMGQFETALEHQGRHLKLAQEESNLLEQQRALATIGRTYYLQSESSDSAGTAKYLLKSQRAYLDSLQICDCLINLIPEKEVLEMRARLYLNLGLVYQWKKEYREAKRFVNKALVISLDQKLKDNIFRCHFSMSDILLTDNQFEMALQSAKSAFSVAKEHNKKIAQVDALMQMGLVLLRLGEFDSALNALKKVYKCKSPTMESDGAHVRHCLKIAIKGVKLAERLKNCSAQLELMEICERLGDLYSCSEVKRPEQALKSYLEQLQHAQALAIPEKGLGPVFVSIAATYCDLGRYEKALEFYYRELDTRHGDLKEKSVTYTEIARVLEEAGADKCEIKDIYLKAVECAEASKSCEAEVKVYREFVAFLDSCGDDVEQANARSKLKSLETEFNLQVGAEDDSSVKDESSLDLDSEDLLLIESDSENEDDEEPDVGVRNKRTSSRGVKAKLEKRNAQGETPLHVAAINGKLERVKELLALGADVHARDTCGWQPLSEACNYGYFEIAKVLIEHGADVNDPGRSGCNGITPLHDACQNGHFEIVQLLLNHGADVNLKDSEGRNPLQCVQHLIREYEEEFSYRSEDAGELKALHVSRKKVEQYLLQLGSTPSLSMRGSGVAKDRNALLQELASSSDEEPGGSLGQSKRQKVDVASSSAAGFSSVPKKTAISYTEKQASRNIHASAERTASNAANGQNLILEDACDEDSSYGSMGESRETAGLLADLEVADVFATSSSTPKAVSAYSSPGVLKERRSARSRLPTASHGDSGSSAGNHNAQVWVDSIGLPRTSPRKIQSRIEFRRTPSPALIDEHDPRLGDFIVDDMQMHSTKKRKRQVRLNFPKEARSTHGASFGERRIRRVDRVTHPVSSTREVTPIPVPADAEVVPLQAQMPPLGVETRPGSVQKLVFRIKVRIHDKLLLIPCARPDELTVDWLVSETRQRYQGLTAVYAKLALQTADGALLNTDDVISNVIVNNEEVVGSVIGLEFPPMMERYRKSCLESNVDEQPDIREQLDLATQLHRLSLCSTLLHKDDVRCLATAICYSSDITAIDFSGTFIGDEGFSLLARGLVSTPNILVVNLSCTGITATSLRELAGVIRTEIQGPLTLIAKHSPLANLVELSLDHNDLDDDSTSTCGSLSDVLTFCSKLEVLNLCSCGLRSEVFSPGRPFARALKDSYIKALNVANNSVSGEGYRWLLQSLNSSSIQFLDLSPGNMDIYTHEDLIGCLVDFCQQSGLNVKELRVRSLVEVGNLHRLASAEPLQRTLERLDVRHCEASTLVLKQFVGALPAFAALKLVDMSGSARFDSTVLDSLLSACGSESCSIENLRLSSCGIDSPLPERVFGSITRIARLRSVKSMCLDLSDNDLSQADKFNLESVWRSEFLSPETLILEP